MKIQVLVVEEKVVPEVISYVPFRDIHRPILPRANQCSVLLWSCSPQVQRTAEHDAQTVHIPALHGADPALPGIHQVVTPPPDTQNTCSPPEEPL